MSEWQFLRLEELLHPASVSYGIVQPGQHLDQGVPIVRVSDLDGNSVRTTSPLRVSPALAEAFARTRLSGGEVLLSIVGTIGRVAVAPPDLAGWNVARAVAVLRPVDSADAPWIRWALLGPEAQTQMQVRKSDTVQATLNLRDLRELAIPWPDPKERRRICEVLGALDDLIEANRVLAQQLTATARAAYDRLVEPCSPETPFSETVDVISGGTPKTTVPEYWGGGIPWYSVVDAPASDSPWVLSTAKTISPTGLANSPTRLLPERATIISARGTVGTLALVGTPMAMNQSCYGLRSLVGSQGFFTYFSTKDIVDELRQGAHGSVFDTITRDSLSRVMVRVPDESAINGFEVKVTPLMDLARELAAENLEINRTRDELLPLLMSGRVRVSEDFEVA